MDTDLTGSLKGCSEFIVPQWYGDHVNAAHTELHGFCDASQRGYGCCVYFMFDLLMQLEIVVCH